MEIIKAAIITVSDKGSKGEREDLSGPVIKEIIEKYGYKVVEYKIIPDDFDIIRKEISKIADEEIANIIFTTGGTGFSVRDVTPEATKASCYREVPGIPEAMRSFSMTVTKRAMLTRATAGIRKNTLVINMPGSPKAVRESLEYIVETLRHGIEILMGNASECAR